MVPRAWTLVFKRVRPGFGARLRILIVLGGATPRRPTPDAKLDDVAPVLAVVLDFYCTLVDLSDPVRSRGFDDLARRLGLPLGPGGIYRRYAEMISSEPAEDGGSAFVPYRPAEAELMPHIAPSRRSRWPFGDQPRYGRAGLSGVGGDQMAEPDGGGADRVCGWQRQLVEDPLGREHPFTGKDAMRRASRATNASRSASGRARLIQPYRSPSRRRSRPRRESCLG